MSSLVLAVLTARHVVQLWTTRYNSEATPFFEKFITKNKKYENLVQVDISNWSDILCSQQYKMPGKKRHIA